jgi:hypothetical protein
VSDLTNMEKGRFEKLLDLGSGYVLNFSNRTFEEFVTDGTGRDIYHSRYDYGSGSKANRLTVMASIGRKSGELGFAMIRAANC